MWWYKIDCLCFCGTSIDSSRRCQSTSYYAFSFLPLPGKRTSFANLHHDFPIIIIIVVSCALFGH